MISSFIDIQLLFTWHKLMRFHCKKTIHPYYTIELRTGVHLGTIHYFRNEKCVRNVSYNCFWDNHWGRTGQLLWRMDIPLNNQPKHARSWLLISQLFQGTSWKKTHKQCAISYTGLEKGELNDWSSYQDFEFQPF